MLDEIKEAVDNMLDDRILPGLVPGTVVNVECDIDINAKSPIPSELIVGNLKNNLKIGDKVWMLRDDRGQLFYVLEVIE